MNERRRIELQNAKWDLGRTHDGFRSVAEGGITICKVGDLDLFPEIEQDAHLIAAAPDLLRAVTAYNSIDWPAFFATLAIMVDNPAVQRDIKSVQEQVEHAKTLAITAIAKAKGA